MSRTQVIERESVHDVDIAPTKGDVAIFQAPRLPYHEAFKERFGIERMQWKALVEACYPNAKTIDSVAMVLSYCKARNLDPFKRPVHIVPMWNSNVIVQNDDGTTSKGGYVDTIWPSIAELRTTAFRTGQYAGKDETQFGPMIEQTFAGKVQFWENRQRKYKDIEITEKFPEWAQVTLYRMVGNVRCAFVGPKVYWLESYATQGKTDLPNEMWQTRPVGQLDKCAEAAALRCAFPEEIGNQYAAEEMEGRRMIVDPADGARDITPTTAAPRKAPPPPTHQTAEQTQQVLDAPATVPDETKAGEAETVTEQPRKAPPPPAQTVAEKKPAPVQPPEDDGLDIPLKMRRPLPEKKAAPAADADPAPNPLDDLSAFFQWVDRRLGAITADKADTLPEIWEQIIEPKAKDIFPGDRETLDAVYRRHEQRLAP